MGRVFPTGVQLKMARVGVGYTLRELGAASGLSANAVCAIERGGQALARSLEALVVALEEAGAEFGDENWVNVVAEADR